MEATKPTRQTDDIVARLVAARGPEAAEGELTECAVAHRSVADYLVEVDAPEAPQTWARPRMQPPRGPRLTLTA